MRLALFDIDGTLLTGAGSERRFFLYLLRSGLLGPRQLLAGARYPLRWAPHFGRHVFKKNKAYLDALAIGQVAELARQWVATGGLEAAWYRPCVSRLREHLEAGDRVVLLSGTPDFLADAIGRRLGVSENIGSVCESRDGRFTAAPPRRHPFGAEKAVLARALSAGLGIESADLVAYADSVQDLLLLEWAGTAVAVRPDAGLRRIATRRGWELLGARRAGNRNVEPLSAPNG